MLTLGEAAFATGGELMASPETLFHRVSTDSRDIRPGDLFVALHGPHFDGHAFVETALAQGAIAAVVSQPNLKNCIRVPNTLLALSQLAAFWRGRFLETPLVAITGSNGKTTVKEMVASILSLHAGKTNIHVTKGNLNNHIGVPLTLLGIRSEHRFIVVEMGMSNFGEIAHLSRLARPTLAIITNARRAHLEKLGSIQGIAQAKGEIFEGLCKQGVAIINVNDSYATYWAKKAMGFKQQNFGLGSADVRASGLHCTAQSSHFTLDIPSQGSQVKLSVPGEHNILNALAAAAITDQLHIPLATIVQGLETYRGFAHRLEMKTAFNGALLVDDTYNANPDSMRAAIDVLTSEAGYRVLILGDMVETGPDALLLHAEVGTYAREKGVEMLYTFGENMAEAAKTYGSPHYTSLEALIHAVRKALPAHARVLVKGSRFMRMERVVDALQTTTYDSGDQ